MGCADSQQDQADTHLTQSHGIRQNSRKTTSSSRRGQADAHTWLPPTGADWFHDSVVPASLASSLPLPGAWSRGSLLPCWLFVLHVPLRVLPLA